MKKYFLLILILVATFHEGLDFDNVLDSQMNPSTMSINHHSQIDDLYEVDENDNTPEQSVIFLNTEAAFFSFQENFCQIWKPPVIC